ncbi:hypothetical protein HMN09_01108400 [Mycena chlorophos]|uniref:Chromatin elongation factor SPT5 n=1 Tax=Mycena chlorophos TaxID=658473 RepID=A0A8H6SBI7_MYCCL|nr:hypothetical protein HMN09_01108400 [Mycena chlorophos]
MPPKRKAPAPAATTRKPRRREPEVEKGSESESESASEHEKERRNPRKKQKRTSASAAARFLDLAAVSDDEEGEDDEDEDDGGINDFVQDSDEDEDYDDEAPTGRDAVQDTNIDEDTEADEPEKSPEQIALELKRRYKAQRAALKFTGEANNIPQRLLIPSVDDPSLWQVRVKPGREREMVFALMRKSITMPNPRPTDPQAAPILSIFTRDSIQGSIYIEAHRVDDVNALCSGIVGINLNGYRATGKYSSYTYYTKTRPVPIPTAVPGVQLVPIEERAALLSLKPHEVELGPGSWVRFKRGTYRGDLAQVVEVIEPGEHVNVRFVPRIDLRPVDAEALDAAEHPQQQQQDGEPAKKKKKPIKSFMGLAGARNTGRPPQKLFNPSQVADAFGAASVVRQNQVYLFQGEVFKDGFVERDIKKLQLVWEEVNPTLAELVWFGVGEKENDSMVHVDLSAVDETARKAGIGGLKPGDRVEVFDGEQTRVYGIIAEIHKDTVVISVRGLQQQEMDFEMVEVPARNVRKRFASGDHVKVISGHGAGETGLVVTVHGDVVTFLSDTDLREVSVLAKDIREAAEVGSGVNRLENYELHQLVQLDIQTTGIIFKTESSILRVLDENNVVRQVEPHQIAFALALDTKLTAIDAEGKPVRMGDLMKEVVVPAAQSPDVGRRGRVLRILPRGGKVFLYNTELQENGGVFVVYARKLVPQTPKDDHVQKHVPKGTSYDPLVGANVMIVKGPMKGYAAMVVSTQGTKFRVELQAASRTIMVEQTMLRLRSENGQLAELDTFVRRPSSRPRSLLGDDSFGNQQMASPLSRGTSSPADGGGWGTAVASGGTPAWGASGGQTPGWSANANANAGGATPAWSSSAKTPNPYTDKAADAGGGGWGGATPAWLAGKSKTPNPYNAVSATTGGWGGSTPGPHASANANASGSGSTSLGGWDDPNPSWMSEKAASPDPNANANTGANVGGSVSAGGWDGASPSWMSEKAASPDANANNNTNNGAASVGGWDGENSSWMSDKAVTPNANANAGGSASAGGWGDGSPSWKSDKAATPNPYSNTSTNAPGPVSASAGGWGSTDTSWMTGKAKTPNPYTTAQASATATEFGNGSAAASGGWEEASRAYTYTYPRTTTNRRRPEFVTPTATDGGWAGAKIRNRNRPGAAADGLTSAPTPATNNAPTPAWVGVAPTPGSWQHAGGFSLPTNATSAPTPEPLAHSVVSLRDTYTAPEAWLFDPICTPHLSRILVRIQNTSSGTSTRYLEGEFEGRIAQVVVAARVAVDFVQTAMIHVLRFPVTVPDEEDPTRTVWKPAVKRAGFPTRYLVPAEPTQFVMRRVLGWKSARGPGENQQEEALVVHDEHHGLKGRVVKLRDVPSDDAEKVIVSPVGMDGVYEMDRDRLVLLAQIPVLEEGEIEE